MKKISTFLSVSVCCLSLIGCANTGAKFNSNALQSQVDPNTSEIYFYRSNAFVGSAVSFPILANKTEIGTLDNGAYFKVTLQPGLYKIHSDTHLIDRVSSFTFNPGQRYFVRAYIDQGVWVSSVRFENKHELDAISDLNHTAIQLGWTPSNKNDSDGDE